MFFFSLFKKETSRCHGGVLFVPPGAVGVPAGVLQHPDGAAGALADEPLLVLQDLQGHGENAVQSEAECENGLGCTNGSRQVAESTYSATRLRSSICFGFLAPCRQDSGTCDYLLKF